MKHGVSEVFLIKFTLQIANYHILFNLLNTAS